MPLHTTISSLLFEKFVFVANYRNSLAAASHHSSSVASTPYLPANLAQLSVPSSSSDALVSLVIDSDSFYSAVSSYSTESHPKPSSLMNSATTHAGPLRLVSSATLAKYVLDVSVLMVNSFIFAVLEFQSVELQSVY